MEARDLKDRFGHAYYRYLCGFEFRKPMVQCGIDALTTGIEGANVEILAGADQDEPEDLLRVSTAAAEEVGVSLPGSGEQRAWCVRITEDLESRGLGLRERSPEEVVDDNLFIICQDLRSATASRDIPALERWLVHLADLPGHTTYQAWLETLTQLRDGVAKDASATRIAHLVHGVTELLQARAFGATTAEHVAWSWRLRKATR